MFLVIALSPFWSSLHRAVMVCIGVKICLFAQCWSKSNLRNETFLEEGQAFRGRDFYTEGLGCCFGMLFCTEDKTLIADERPVLTTENILTWEIGDMFIQFGKAFLNETWNRALFKGMKLGRGIGFDTREKITFVKRRCIKFVSITNVSKTF